MTPVRRLVKKCPHGVTPTNCRQGCGGAWFRVPDAEGDLGSMKDVPLVSGMRQTGEVELSELGKYCTSCRAVVATSMLLYKMHAF